MKLRDLPRFSIPDSLEEIIDWGLEREGYSKAQTQKLATAILSLSKRYQEGGEKSDVWQTVSHRSAYWCYFLPWNFLRLQAVVQEGQRRGFFEGVTDVVDYGAGLGTTQLVLGSTALPHSHLSMVAIEASPVARQLNEAWQTQFGSSVKTRVTSGYSLLSPPSPKSVAVLSYSLNEVSTLPPNLLLYDRVLILEPSTRQAGRRLMTVRDEFLRNGFHCWAPCTHETACPLLASSKTDWCHDRILVERPDWMMKIEQHLPLDNRSLTFSYLLLAKGPPVRQPGIARVIGDTQMEKGKVRQAICRGAQREFLAWLKKEGRPPIIARGSLVAISDSTPCKGNEVRPAEDLEVFSAHGQQF